MSAHWDPKIEGVHRYTLSWPGNCCVDCGMDGPETWDDALIDCPKCSKLPEGTEVADCECCGTGALPNPNQVVPPCPSSTSPVPVVSPDTDGSSRT